MHPIQFVLVAFALFALTRVVARIRSGVIRVVEGALWVGLWCAVAAVALAPGVAQWLADLAGVGRGADAVIYLTLAALVYGGFRIRLTIRRLEREVTQLVRALALEHPRRPERER